MRARQLMDALAAALLVLGVAPIAVGADALSPRYAPGRVVYEKWCAPCHDPGITHPGTHALMAKYPNSSRASGAITAWTDLQASYVRFMVRHGMSVMPPFRKTEISDTELAALAAYLARNTPANGS